MSLDNLQLLISLSMKMRNMKDTLDLMVQQGVDVPVSTSNKVNKKLNEICDLISDFSSTIIR